MLHVPTCVHFVGDGKDSIQFRTSGDMDETEFNLASQFCTSPFKVLLLTEIPKATSRGRIPYILESNPH